MQYRESNSSRKQLTPEQEIARQNSLASVNGGLGVSFKSEITDAGDIFSEGETITRVLAGIIEEEGYEATPKRIEDLAGMIQDCYFDDEYGAWRWGDEWDTLSGYIISAAAQCVEEIVANGEWDKGKAEDSAASEADGSPSKEKA